MLRLLRRLRYWMHSRQADADLAEELELHHTLTMREMEQGGMAPTDAAFASKRVLGSATRAREDARAVWVWPWLESIWQDLEYGLRNLRRQPGFTLLALAALGSAIGLNTSLFTAINAIALRPWPVRDPGRVVNIYSINRHAPKGFGNTGGFSLAEYRYISDQAKSFSGLLAIRGSAALRLDGYKTVVSYVSANFFRALGIEIERGRGFLPEEDRVDAPEPVAVLSYRAWQNLYAGDPDIVGRRVRLADVPFTVVGVSSRDFNGTSPDRIDAWLPMSAMLLANPQEPDVREFLTNPAHCCASLAGRLAPGVSREQARAELELLHDQFQSAHFREDDRETRGILLTGTAFLSDPGAKRQKILPAFALMFLGVLLILVLACANVGNLLLARAAARGREIAVRLSLGASRRRLIRQLVTENLVLAGIAGAIGIAIAYVLPSYIVNRVAGDVSLHLVPDVNVLAFTAGVAALACVVFGLTPALHSTRGNLVGALKDQPGSPSMKLSLRGVLLSVQVAVSVVLLVGAGLMVRGVQHARTQDPGFAIANVSVVSFDLPANSYDTTRKRAFFGELLHAIEALPAGQHVGFTMLAPLSRGKSYTSFRLPGEDSKQDRMILFHEVSGGYFDALRIPIVAGRNLEFADLDRKVILVNETMAKRSWPGENAVGKTIISGQPREVIGVVKDVYTTDLGQIEPTFYQPLSGHTIPQLLVRDATPGSVQQIAALLKRLDARVQTRVAPLADNLDRWLSPMRVGAALAGVLGGLALALASIGVFGVFAYVVQQRTREIGIRMALGARPIQVLSIVLGDNGRALLVGFVAGIAGAFAASRLLHGYLYGVSPFDPLAYGSVALLLTLAALVATYLPARRASRVDPIRALRYE